MGLSKVSGFLTPPTERSDRQCDSFLSTHATLSIPVDRFHTDRVSTHDMRLMLNTLFSPDGPLQLYSYPSRSLGQSRLLLKQSDVRVVDGAETLVDVRKDLAELLREEIEIKGSPALREEHAEVSGDCPWLLKGSLTWVILYLNVCPFFHSLRRPQCRSCF
jgi:hypothetical protein